MNYPEEYADRVEHLEATRDALLDDLTKMETARDMWKREAEHQAAQFQAETRRTSDQYRLLQRVRELLCEVHTPGAWSRNCARCALVVEIDALQTKPLEPAHTLPGAHYDPLGCPGCAAKEEND